MAFGHSSSSYWEVSSCPTLKLGSSQLGRLSPALAVAFFVIFSRYTGTKYGICLSIAEEISKPQGGSTLTVVQYLQKRLAVCSAVIELGLPYSLLVTSSLSSHFVR